MNKEAPQRLESSGLIIPTVVQYSTRDSDWIKIKGPVSSPSERSRERGELRGMERKGEEELARIGFTVFYFTLFYFYK